MKKLLMSLTAIFMLGQAPIVQASFDDYQASIGVSQSKIEYNWYGASSATFQYDLTVVRIEVAHKSGVAVRYGHGFGMGTDTQTTITNQTFTIDFQKYREFELLYRYQVNKTLGVYGGIGYYLQTTPIYDTTGENMIHYDEDNDKGFFIGLDVRINDHLHLEVFGKETSRIGSRGIDLTCDQDCIDNWVSKGSSIKQIGIGIIYKF